MTASVGAVPLATLVMLLFPALIPSFVTLGPSLILKPSVFKTVSPTVTLPAALTLVTLIVLLKLNVTLSFVGFLVITILPSALFKSTVSPGSTLLLLVPLLTVKFQPLLAIFATSFNCETFTASVSAVPAATPVILLPAALIPALVTLGPPSIVKPSLLMVVSPAFTLLTLMSLFNLTLTSSPDASVVMFSSSPLIATVEPNLSTLVEPLSPVKVKPFVSTLVFASTPF